MPVKRLIGQLLALLMLSGLFALGQPENAFAQAGSTGGTIGKQDKSISGGSDAVAPERALLVRKPSRPRSQGRADEREHDASSGCAGIVGEWQFPLGQKIIFKSGGSTQSSFGDTGTWACAKGTVVTSWKRGYRDHITLSPDGTQLSVINNVFGKFSVQK